MPRTAMESCGGYGRVRVVPPYSCHLSRDEAPGLHDGALRLGEMRPVDSHCLIHKTASLTDGAFAALIDLLIGFMRVLDRRPVT